MINVFLSLRVEGRKELSADKDRFKKKTCISRKS